MGYPRYLRKIDQTRFGKPHGNCFQACLATVLGVDLEDVPNWNSYKDDSDDAITDWFQPYQAWAHSLGFHLLMIRFEEGGLPKIPMIATGNSPRGLNHSVVVIGDFLYHDPHPSRHGLLEDGKPWEYIVFVALDPGVMKRTTCESGKP